MKRVQLRWYDFAFSCRACQWMLMTTGHWRHWPIADEG